jgi:carbonic anhydrase
MSVAGPSLQLSSKPQETFMQSNLQTRRDWFRASLAGGALAATATLSSRQLAMANEGEPIPANATPKEVLAALYEGNARFVSGDMTSPHRNMKRLKEIAGHQTPFAAFLGCADSRVPIEMIFDQGFGDLFVNRVAGNIATSEHIGSLEFGVKVLGAKVLYVLGHTACGAVKATMERMPVPGQISSLFQHIRPAVRVAGGDLEVAVRENVRMQAQIVAESSPVIVSMVKAGEVVVAGGVYDLASGKVTPVEVDVE